MKRFFLRCAALISLALTVVPALAQEPEVPDDVALWQSDPGTIFDASDITIDDFIWIARPLIIFADSPNDPNFREQLSLLSRRPDELIERDVVIITDTAPDEPTDLRQSLRPRGFMLVIMGKDGQIELRKPQPWDVREISRSIDKMPLRRQEVDAERFRN